MACQGTVERSTEQPVSPVKVPVVIATVSRRLSAARIGASRGRADRLRIATIAWRLDGHSRHLERPQLARGVRFSITFRVADWLKLRGQSRRRCSGST
jgi:hypothetical protein